MNTALAIFVSLFFLSHEAVASPIDGRDIYVIDGDTIRVGGTTYRLVGFDTPETWRPQCDYERAAGEAATNQLKAYIGQQPVTLELVVLPGLDRYERHLARFFVDGMDVADLMINAGLARLYDGGRRTSWCENS